jgi:lauroyl/myristoyl acyltransferase
VPATARFRHDGLFWRRLAYWGSTRAPRWWRRTGPGLVALIVFALVRENRRNAIRNMQIVLGRRGRLRDALAALRVFREFAYCVSESFEFNSTRSRDLEIEAPPGFDPAKMLGGGRGMVVLTSHFGSWEIGARVLSRFGRPVNVVMARESNPTAESFQRHLREMGGVRVIHSDSSVFSSFNMIHALRRGEVIAIQLDRAAPGQVTKDFDFFGRQARFQYGPFVLARLAGVPIWPVFAVRVGPRRYRFLAEELRHIDRGASETETEAVMHDVVRSLERYVAEYPFQWFQFLPFWDTDGRRG